MISVLFHRIVSSVAYNNLKLSVQGHLLNLSCSTVPTFVLSITATTQVGPQDGTFKLLTKAAFTLNLKLQVPNSFLKPLFISLPLWQKV